MQTWQKVALGCGVLVVLGVLLSGALILGIVIGSSTSGQASGPEPAPSVQPPPETTVSAPSEPAPAADESGTEKVVIRVVGTEGLKFTGDIGTLSGSRSVEGEIPEEYEVRIKTGSMDFDSVSAFFSRDFMDETDGTLGTQIVYGDEVVKESKTNAQSGSVSVNWSPQDR